MDSGGDAPSGRGDTTSAHDACEASGSRSVDIVPVLSTTPAADSLKVSARARLALEASPYSERQVRRRESRARAKTHAWTQPRGVGLGAHPSTSKAPVVGPDDCRARDTEKRVAAADRDATPRASAPSTSTPKPSARVVRQSPEAHARRLKAAADELLHTPLPRVANDASPVGGFVVGSDASHVSPSPPRRARFGDPTPASTPAGRAAMALVRSRASAAWTSPGTDWGDRARDEDAGPPSFGTGTPVGRAAAARDRLRQRREAMARRVAAAERAYGASVRASSSVSGGKARRARTNERRDADATDADVGTDADAPAATPATPTWSTSYGGGRVSARRAARLAAMTPHREPREFREFRELREKNEGPEPRPGQSETVPETRRRVSRTPAKDDASTAPRVSRKPPSPSKDEALAALRETMARRKRERRTRREATLKERARLAAEATATATAPATSPRTPTGARLSDRSFERARAAYGTDPTPRPAPVPVTARPLVAVRKTPEPPVLPTSSEKKRRRERRDAAVVAAAASPYSASPRVALRRSRFVPAASPADALPTLVAFRPRPPDRGLTEPGDAVGPDGIVVLPRRPRRPTRPARPARRDAATPSAAAEAALPPALGRADAETRMPKPRRRAASEDETRTSARRATEAVQREREKEKTNAMALERTARRLREAAARRARVREARRDKARTLTPGKPKPGMDVFPNLVASRTTRVGGFSSPFPRLGSHALGSHLPARARDRSRAEGAASKSPFAPAAAATSRRRDRAARAARDAVDDVVDRLVLDVATAARRDDARTVRAERAERRRVREGRRAAEIYAQNLAKKTAEAHRLARRAEKRRNGETKPTRTRPSPSRPTKPKPSRVDGVVRSRVDASARREMAAKRRERRRLIEARRAADFARLTLAREKELLSSSSPLETTPSKTIEKAKKERAPSRALSSFELELARFPRGVSAFDWEVEALPLGAAAASARAASAFAGVSALKSTRKRRTSASTRDATARRARRREVEAPQMERRAEKETIRATDPDPIDPEALAAAADALRAVEAAAFATLASFAEVDETVNALIEREAHIEAVAARAARGAKAKAARETALAEARAEAAAEAAREAALAEALRAAAEAARSRRKSAAEHVAAYIIDTVLVNETVRVAEELHLARRVAALRERHEALRKRLEWRDRLEHTPRAVLRRTLFTSDEEAIIRFIEPALAIRTVKDARYDPFANGPDLSWAVTDEERARRAAAEASAGEASAVEAAGCLASAPSAKNSGGAFGWDPAPIAVGAAAASRRAAATYGGASWRETRSRRRSRARERLVAALVRDAIGRVVGGDDASSSAFESVRAEKSSSQSAATDAPRGAVAPDAIDLELDWKSSKTSREKHSKSTRGVSFIHAALLPDAAAETASSGSEPEPPDDFRARLLERRVAKPANRGSRIAFEKPRAGARPPSPVSPLTPSGVVISPLSISLRGVRKSLA